MRILVTGGSGFIGTNLIENLAQVSASILNIDKSAPRNREHQRYWKKCNILDKPQMASLIGEFQPTHVVHLAAKTGVYETSAEEFIDNTQGTSNLLEVLKPLSRLKRVIFTSTLLVCKMGYIPQHETDYSPSTAYGKSKVEMEKIIRREKELPFEWVIIRPISIWGPWFREPYKNFFEAIECGWYFHIGGGHYKRSLGYVENAIFQIEKLLAAESALVNKKTFYVADETSLDLYDLANEIANQLGREPIRHLPYVLIKLMAWLGDVLLAIGYKRFPMSSFRLKNILTEYVYDLTPTSNITGPAPYNYREGVHRTLKWLKQGA
ncbi:MAG TPA: NAD(P)-dependent oxidoreductase [Syntrophorhabdaceae bacterium]|jgi:nucleoside-diphosphate-sugar epimerase